MSNALPVSGSLEEALVWLEKAGLDACDLDDRASIRAVLLQAESLSPNHPVVLAIKAGLARVDGDVGRAIKTYRKAMEQLDSRSALRADVLEDLISLEGSRDELKSSQTSVTIAVNDHPNHLGLKSVRAIVRAVEYDLSAIEDIEDVLEQAPALPDVRQARALQRVAVAAFHLNESRLMEEAALRAVRAAERCHAHRIAARAYYQLYVYYRSVLCDATQATFYVTEAMKAADIAEDVSLRHTSLIALYALEAGYGNRTRVADLREQIQTSRRANEYHEEFVALIADALWFGWNDRFDVVVKTLAAINRGNLSESARSLHGGLLALAHVALDQVSEALSLARNNAHFGVPSERDRPYEGRYRHLGRVLTSGALALLNQRTKAERLLDSRKYNNLAPHGVKELAKTLATRDFSKLVDTAPDIYGYGLYLAAVHARLDRSYRAVKLTEREVEVLELFSAGKSVKSIAVLLGRSPFTVNDRLKRAMEKLAATNLVHAIAEARRRGIIP